LPLSRIVETGGSKAALDKLPPKLGRIVDGVFWNSRNGVRCSNVRPLSGATKWLLNQDLPPRAASTYQTASNYQTRAFSGEDRLRWASTPASARRSRTVFRGDTMITRRHVLASALAAPAILRLGTGTAHAATTLKISHQFPGGTIDKGDFRDRLCRMFAAEVTKRSGGEIVGEIYPNSSLVKTNAQFSAMRKGALDISLYPMPYAGGELPETNIGLMPGLVATYDQGMRWKKEAVGKALTDFLADKGIILLSWVWQAGGVASRSKAIVAPEDAKGLKVRGGSREMDMVLQTAGAAVLSVPSNEIYAAMQTGACDAGITSSTSLISFRLEEVAKSLTSGADASYWFMLEPLMMSKAIFDKLPKNQQDIILAVGTELEAFGKKGAQDDDIEVAKVYEKAGAKVSKLDKATVGKWRDIARDTAWKDYGAKTAASAKLLKLASDVSA
jgi:TRAP-type C4-dicarboxylate transport system substrate-binding protein